MDLRNLNTTYLNNLKSFLTQFNNTDYEDEFLCAYQSFFQNIGENHYHLFCNISNKINNKTIVDLGTYRGFSALAFSFNETNKVLTFDVEYDYRNRHHTIYQDNIIKNRKNIQFIIHDNWKDNFEKYKNEILNAYIIFMDAGDHLNKTMELQLIKFLNVNNYKGIVIFDDINLNDDMKYTWSIIPNDEKIDITLIGHWSGTGLWCRDKNLLKNILY